MRFGHTASVALRNGEGSGEETPDFSERRGERPGIKSALDRELVATFCVYCRRPLTDIDSQSRGCGPVCYENYGSNLVDGEPNLQEYEDAVARYVVPGVVKDIRDVQKAAVGTGPGTATQKAKEYVERHGPGWRAVAQRLVWHGSMVESFGTGELDARNVVAVSLLALQALGRQRSADAIQRIQFNNYRGYVKKEKAQLSRLPSGLLKLKWRWGKEPWHATARVTDETGKKACTWVQDHWTMAESSWPYVKNALACAEPWWIYEGLDGKWEMLPGEGVVVEPKPQPVFNSPQAQTNEPYVNPASKFQVGQTVKWKGQQYYVRWVPPATSTNESLGLHVSPPGKGGQYTFVSFSEVQIFTEEQFRKEREEAEAVRIAERDSEAAKALAQRIEKARSRGIEVRLAPAQEVADEVIGDEDDEPALPGGELLIVCGEPEGDEEEGEDVSRLYPQPWEINRLHAEFERHRGTGPLPPRIARLVEEKPKYVKGELPEFPADLQQHQIEAVNWLHEVGSGLIAYEQGLGKTAVAITAMTLPAIVVTTTSMLMAWKNEVARWRPGLEVFVPLTEEESLGSLDADALTDCDVIVVSYANVQTVATQLFEGMEWTDEEPVRDLSPEILRKKWQTLICDESQLAKSGEIVQEEALVRSGKMKSSERGRYGGSIRGGTCMKMALKVPRVFCLTGTPVKNRAEELWAQLHMIDPLAWNDRSWFEKNFCLKREKERAARNNPKRRRYYNKRSVTLNRMVFEPYAPYGLRRTKDDVGGLPSKQRQAKTVVCEGPLAEEYVQIAADFIKWLASVEGKNVAAARVRQYVLARFTALRMQAARMKVPYAIEWINTHFDETTRPLMVMGSFVDPLLEIRDSFRAMGWQVGSIMGSDSPKERAATVADFQAGKLDMIVCSIAAASAGITLTRASEGLFLERTWSPADLLQAEDRLHRIGQKNQVTITYLDAAGTVDELLAGLLKQKSACVAGVLDGQNVDDAKAQAMILGALSRMGEGFKALASFFDASEDDDEEEGGTAWKKRRKADEEGEELFGEKEGEKKRKRRMSEAERRARMTDYSSLVKPHPSFAGKLPVVESAEEQRKDEQDVLVITPPQPVVVAEAPITPAELPPSADDVRPGSIEGTPSPSQVLSGEALDLYNEMIELGEIAIAQQLYEAALADVAPRPARAGKRAAGGRKAKSKPAFESVEPGSIMDEEALSLYREMLKLGREDLAKGIYDACLEEAGRQEPAVPASPGRIPEDVRNTIALLRKLGQNDEADRLQYTFTSQGYTPNGRRKSELEQDVELIQRATDTGLIACGWANPLAHRM